MNNPTLPRTDDRAIADLAARWVARRDAGLSPAEEVEFAQWLSRDPRHASAVEHYARTWAIFDRPPTSGQVDAALGAAVAKVKSQRRRRQMLVSGTLALIVTLFAWRGRESTEPAVVATSTNAVLLRPETRTLPDGSIAELKAGAEIALDFGPAKRRVALLRGEAHFKVVSNPARPFIVRAGGVEVRAVGTAFAVQLGGEHVEVLVTEGKVAVDNQGATAGSVVAGQRLVVALERRPEDAEGALPAAQSVTAAEMNERLAWRSPRLEFSRTPLAEAVALMNRTTGSHAGADKIRLVIDGDSPGLAAEPVSGLFRADNAEAFVHVLELSLGVTAERHSENEIVLRKAK